MTPLLQVRGDEQGPQATGEGPGYRHGLGTLLCLNGDNSLRIRWTKPWNHGDLRLAFIVY